MARRPPPGKCVHCTCSFDDLTWDHVFPESWYPETTPPNLEKWEIPACERCNQVYGQLENDLLIRFGLCLDPGDPKSLGIPEKAYRAIDSSYGKNSEDSRLREAKTTKLLGETFMGSEIPRKGLYPNFDRTHGLPSEQQIGLLIKAESIARLTEKIVRGITFLEDGTFIEPPFTVNQYTLSDQRATPLISLLKTIGREYAREPGIVIIRATNQSNKVVALYAIEIWGRFKIYASVTR